MDLTTVKQSVKKASDLGIEVFEIRAVVSGPIEVDVYSGHYVIINNNTNEVSTPSRYGRPLEEDLVRIQSRWRV